MKLNTSKTKEMIVDFRRRAHSEPPVPHPSSSTGK